MSNNQISQGASFTEAVLEFSRSAYSASGNPVFVWVAINWCRNEVTPPAPLPDWCVHHLGQDAGRVSALMSLSPQTETIDGVAVASVGTIGKGPGRAPPTPKPGEILGALGFTRKGWNAFKEAGSKLRAWRAAVQFRLARKAGRSSSEALEEVMDWLGEEDETNAKDIIRVGEHLGMQKPSQETS